MFEQWVGQAPVFGHEILPPPEMAPHSKIWLERCLLTSTGVRYRPAGKSKWKSRLSNQPSSPSTLSPMSVDRALCAGRPLADAPLRLNRGKALVDIAKPVLALVILFSPAITWSQTNVTDQSNPLEYAQQTPASQSNPAPAASTDSGTASLPDKAPAPKKKEDDAPGQQTKRMFWLVPNFAAVSAHTQLPPLSTHDKFVLAAQDSVLDYSSYTWAAMLAEQAMLLNSDPELGGGIKGYGRYYWRAFTDGVSGTFFTEAIVPAITHEDPRYYTMGQGGFFHRTGYAISRAFVTKTDSGGTSFNWSEVAGNALEAGLSTAYYPPQERSLSQTAANFGTQMESAVLNHVFQEFWPDIRKNVFRRK